MKKSLLFLFIFTLALSLGFGQAKKFQISLFGGLNQVLEYGSEDEYLMGENDFPVTPSHTPFSFGTAFAYSLTKNIALELEVRFALSSQVTLVDPSDQDTVEVNTSSHISGTLNFLYHFLNGRIRPYIVFGGGIDKILAKDETYTSDYGYEVKFIAPEKTIDPVAQAGGGIHYLLSQNAGARLDLRYELIFDEPNNINSLNLTLGFFLRF
jgi:outer membrane protein W